MIETRETEDDKSTGTIDIPRNPSAAAEKEEIFSDLGAMEKRHRNADLKQDIAQKRLYFSFTRKITRHWIRFIIMMCSLQFTARVFGRGFEASEFIALITTTTGTLVGFWALVGLYLFPKKGR